MSQSSGTSNHLYGVSFTDANTGTAVGGSGTILRTTNGGSSWISQSSGTTNSLMSVSFTDANTGTVVGGYGMILRTTNAGSSWISQSSGTTNWLYGVSFTDANTGTAVGDYGTILRTNTGGVTGIKEGRLFINPSVFHLMQNYPNPFNPSTTIEFSVPRSGLVSLTVCDLLGREVAVLVNGERAAGTYTSTWDARGVGSGVYFYRLRAGEFSETKKLILMK
jgi:hypothetical protein